MDYTASNARNMGLGVSTDAFNFVTNLKNECPQYAGDLTFFRHYTEVITTELKEFHKTVLTT